MEVAGQGVKNKGPRQVNLTSCSNYGLVVSTSKCICSSVSVLKVAKQGPFLM